jgi:hypothetical protein
MFGFIRRWREASRKAKAYRLEKYGKPETFAENYAKSRKMAKELSDRIPRPMQSTEDRNNILRHATAWELWTGSRFERQDNPIHQMTKDEFKRSCWSKNGTVSFPKNEGYTARSCPVTGDYKKV